MSQCYKPGLQIPNSRGFTTLSPDSLEDNVNQTRLTDRKHYTKRIRVELARLGGVLFQLITLSVISLVLSRLCWAVTFLFVIVYSAHITKIKQCVMF